MMCSSVMIKNQNDVVQKPQGANGPDIVACTTAGERIVAEIKTTSPYRHTDFGAQQPHAFNADITKLTRSTAAHRFFFVTDPQTYTIVQRRYLSTLRDGGIEIILLPNVGHSPR